MTVNAQTPLQVTLSHARRAAKPVQTTEELTLTLDAFVRSIGIRRSIPHALLVGAGASISSGIPSAEKCTWEWKREIFLTNNPGIEEQFSELSLDGVKRRIQGWLDRQGGYPKEGLPSEYGHYIAQCFPIESDRRSFFAEKVRVATPHIGYRLLGQLAQSDLFRSFWTTNFDGLAARAAGQFKIAPIEVGIDSQQRAARISQKGELLCVSMHGDYRFDELKNTPDEIKSQEANLRSSLIDAMANTSLIVCGYSGRDKSIMDALHDCYSQSGSGVLYWCGYGDGEIPSEVAALIKHARSKGRQAYYVPALGFDDLMTRLALHCLAGDERQAAVKLIQEFVPQDKLAREPFQVRKFSSTTLIKSNCFAIDCPSEMLQFDLKKWPAEKVWSFIRERAQAHSVVAVPLKGKIYALGTIDAIKAAFPDNIKGNIERVPVTAKDLAYDDGAIVSLMREALTKSMAERAGLPTDGKRELWKTSAKKKGQQGTFDYEAFESVLLFLRRIGGAQYLVLKPSIRVHDNAGVQAPAEIANPVKLAILGYQHNREFNQAVNEWRDLLLPKGQDPIFEYPHNCGSTFKFKVRRSPVFGEIGLPQGGPKTILPEKMLPLIKYGGVQLSEPNLLVSNKTGTGLIKSPHPIRAIAENYPYDYALTARGFLSSIRVGVICPKTESKNLRRYLQQVEGKHSPSQKERDYLVDYPGFQAAYGLPIEIPEPGHAGWFECPEPTTNDPQTASVELAGRVNQGVESLQSSYAPHVIVVFYPTRWSAFQRYRTEAEYFDVHDFVKAFCVQRGIASQFLNEDTLVDAYQCRVWWWLSLALYVKSMRTPWVLNSLADDTAFVGLGYSIDPMAEKGKHVVLGCSHIYNAKGEGLQYRLTKVEDPVFHNKNPFLSKDDARRTGEIIR